MLYFLCGLDKLPALSEHIPHIRAGARTCRTSETPRLVAHTDVGDCLVRPLASVHGFDFTKMEITCCLTSRHVYSAGCVLDILSEHCWSKEHMK